MNLLPIHRSTEEHWLLIFSIYLFLFYFYFTGVARRRMNLPTEEHWPKKGRGTMKSAHTSRLASFLPLAPMFRGLAPMLRALAPMFRGLAPMFRGLPEVEALPGLRCVLQPACVCVCARARTLHALRA